MQVFGNATLPGRLLLIAFMAAGAGVGPVSAATVPDISNAAGGLNSEGQAYINSRLPGLMPYYGPKYSCAPQSVQQPQFGPTVQGSAMTLGPGTAYQIWEANTGFPNAVPQGQIVQLETTYDNTTGSPLSVTIIASADDIETTYLNGQQVVATSVAGNASQGTAVLNVGVNTITATAENLNPISNAPSPAMYAMVMEDGVGNVLLVSNDSWQLITGYSTQDVEQCAQMAPTPNGEDAEGISPNWSGPPVSPDDVTVQDYVSYGWMSSFPDPAALMIAPSTGYEPSGLTAEYGYTYNNTTGQSISVNLTGLFDNIGTVFVNGVEVMSGGGGLTATTQIPPGISQIVIQNTNEANGSNANVGPSNPMGAALTAIDGNGNVVFDTNSSWILLGQANTGS